MQGNIWNEKISAALNSFNDISKRILNKNSNKIMKY